MVLGLSRNSDPGLMNSIGIARERADHGDQNNISGCDRFDSMLCFLTHWCVFYVLVQTAESSPKTMSAAQVVTYLGGKQHVNVVTNTIAESEYCE